MEAVGFAASIIALIQVSGKKLAGELHILIDVLDNLKDSLDKNPLSPALQKLGEKDGPIPVFAEEMNRLYQKFATIDPSKFSVKFSWPLKDKDIAQTLLSIERHKTVFIFAMNADQLSLSRAIEAYVIDIRHAAKYIKTCLQDTALRVQEIKHEVKNTSATIQEIKSDVGDTNIAIQTLQSSQDVETRTKVLNWLYPESFEIRHLEISGRRRKKTGEWLLKFAEFYEFAGNNPSSPILWGHGIPGAGKTFLSSAVIDHFQSKAKDYNYALAYIYFSYNEQNQQKPLQVLGSLVTQLASQISQLPSYIIDLHARLVKENKRPTQQELYSALVATLKSFDQAFFVFDALDECHQNHQRKTLLPLFHQMALENPSVRIFITSRQYPEDIQASFDMSAKIKLLAKDEDIKLYIQQKIDENPRAKKLTSKGGRLDTIISQLTESANGMFLLVHFHIDLICQQTTTKRIMAELERLRIAGSRSENNPLDPTYNRAIESIRSRPANFGLAKNIFIWLVKAQRTLTVEELQMAISVEHGITELEEEDLPSKETILDVCAGLVIVDEKSGIIRLAHYTVQEYLLRVSLIPEDAHANLYIATSCLAFLLLDVFGHGACFSNAELETRLEYPFLEYAVLHLPFHLKHCDQNLTTDSVLELFRDSKRTDFYSQVRWGYAEKSSGRFPRWKNHNEYPRQSRLHLASIIGHLSSLQIMLKRGDNVMVKCNRRKTALHYAAEGGYLEVARLLIDNGADMSAKDLYNDTPLHEAVGQGHLEVAQLLIDRGINISAKRSQHQRAPLCQAAERGHLEMARLLIDNGADVSANDPVLQKTPLYQAADGGHLEMARLLIDNGAYVSAEDSEKKTPLHQAVKKGHLEMARLLIDNGADVSAKDPAHRTPLHGAVINGRLEMAQLLIDHGSDVREKDSSQLTPLHYAATNGYLEMAQLLINHGAPCSTDSGYETPLHYAAMNGNQLLIDHGADVSAKGIRQQAPLDDAERLMYPKIIQLLKGALSRAQPSSDWPITGRAALSTVSAKCDIPEIQEMPSEGYFQKNPRGNGP